MKIINIKKMDKPNCSNDANQKKKFVINFWTNLNEMQKQKKKLFIFIKSIYNE